MDGFGQAVQRRLRGAALPTLFLGFCAYFAWHAVHGSFGTEAEQRRRDQITAARDVLAEVERERDRLERKVDGLRGEKLDRDQLDERARTLLNLVGRDEIIIPYEPARRLY